MDSEDSEASLDVIPEERDEEVEDEATATQTETIEGEDAKGTDSEQQAALRARLVAHFERWDQAKIPQVDALMSRFAGKEAELEATMAAQAKRGEVREQVVAFYRQRDPSKEPDAKRIDGIMAQYKGREERILEKLGLPPRSSHQGDGL